MSYLFGFSPLIRKCQYYVVVEIKHKKYHGAGVLHYLLLPLLVPHELPCKTNSLCILTTLFVIALCLDIRARIRMLCNSCKFECYSNVYARAHTSKQNIVFANSFQFASELQSTCKAQNIFILFSYGDNVSVNIIIYSFIILFF